MMAIWEEIRFGLRRSLPPTSRRNEDAYTQALADIIAGRSQCWVVYSVEEEKYKLHAFAITMIRPDPLTKHKYLHLYTIYAFSPLSTEDWDRLQDVVESFARDNDCVSLTSFANHPMIIAQFKRRGGTNDWQYWHKEL